MRWFNGEPAGAWAGTRALHYGDGVFRTLLTRDGGVHALAAQIGHLLRDARALALEPPPADVLENETRAAAQALGEGVLRWTLSRVDGGRGYRPQSDACDRLLTASALPSVPAAHWEQGIVLGWSPVLLGIQPRLAGIKHLNRLEQVLASREMPPDVQETLMCDAEGRVICGTRSNVFFVIDGILVTPDLSSAGVAGFQRSTVIAMARERGLGCEIGLIAPDEVRHAQECFVTNSLIGLWPVRRVGRLELPAPGPVTRALDAALQHPWRGS